jgi:hypothetical protein
MSITRRPNVSKTGRPYGTQEIYTVRGTYADTQTQRRIVEALAEEISEDWKDFYDSPDRRRRNMLRNLLNSKTL